MRLNNIGFTINQDLKKIIDEDSANLTQQLNIPSWLLLNGPHGEFELLFTIDPADRNKLEAEASLIGWQPLLLGTVVKSPEIRLSIEGKERQIDTGLLRNSFSVCKGDIKTYIHELLAYHQQLHL
jgi:thiamine-monophosphate kinase